jgi:hypothetical protein
MAATLALKVPSKPWSRDSTEALQKLCDAHDYTASFGSGDSNLLCEIRVVVDDIWQPWSGAAGARLLNLVLDALSVPTDARFNFALLGSRSRRLKQKVGADLRAERN